MSATHRKRAPDALSARYTSWKPTTKKGFYFGVEVLVMDERTGKPIHEPDGSVVKTKIPMTGARFPDGTPQSLYKFPTGHPNDGVFKGMKSILEERGTDITKCSPPAINCRVLYNQPDFQNIELL